MKFTPKKGVMAAVFGIILVVVVAMGGSLIENVPAGNICVKQAITTGELTPWVTAGPKAQLFGDLTYYTKSNQLWFSSQTDEGGTADQSLKITFNDAGTAMVSGSVRYDLPVDPVNMLKLHEKYRSMPGIEDNLIRTVVRKAIFASGPLVSSRESYAEKRSQLVNFIEDQAKFGIYATTTRDTKITDELTGETKTVTLTERIADPKSPGGWKRQEESPIAAFGITFYNFAVNDIRYDDKVQAQIEQQRKITMDVQTAIANAKKAEQDKLTTERQGAADAAKAEWAQKVIKAQKVTEAEQAKEVAETKAAQELEVAKLDRQAAEEYKKATILRAEGDAQAAKMRIAADGALDKKLATYERVYANMAGAIAKRQVPDTVIVSGGANGGTGSDSEIMGILNMIQVDMAKKLALDPTVGK